tara:strand:+ start:434 stop:877 length:444 start_codon:yes stop_codon:yes gene_type:complete
MLSWCGLNGEEHSRHIEGDDMAISKKEELGEALKNGESRIEIEGDLAKRILRIKATGPVAWAIAIGCIGIAVVVAIGSGGAAAPVSAVGLVPAVGILGGSTVSAAISIAVAAGGVGVLSRLYSGYDVEKEGEDRVVLIKKSEQAIAE